MMRYTPFALLVVSAVALAGGSDVAMQPAPVRLDSGLVSGIVGSTADIRVFNGIPYASPPV